MFFACVGAVLVVIVVVALIVDRRDRNTGGHRVMRMPGWLERRGRGQMASGPVYWGSADYRPVVPREHEDQEHNPAARSDVDPRQD